MEMPEKIKIQRKNKRLTLENLAKKIGCTSSHISRIEKGKVRVSIKQLRKLAKALGVEIKDFLSDNECQNRVFFTKNDHIQIIYPGGHIKSELLVSNISSKIMEPLYKIIPVGFGTESEQRHSGEEFGYILKGKLELRIGNQTAILEAGDSF